jgi:hypothetical protein
MDDLTGNFSAGGDEMPDCAVDAPAAVAPDERRLHVRAYNHWVSLLNGRAFPSIEDIDPARLGDFSRHGVLLDFTANRRDPAIRYLGPALREECGFGQDIASVGVVPKRSLLSRLTDHYLQIIASRSPVGFDAEFVNQRGLNTLYRGILMPFSSNGVTIDFIFGVINWKELADTDTTAELMLQLDETLRRIPPLDAAAPPWADGPNAAGGGLAFEDGMHAANDTRSAPSALTFVDLEETGGAPSLQGRLEAARAMAEEARMADGRSRTALYQALGLAHDFAIGAEERPDDYQRMLADNAIKPQARAPMTAVAKLIFGPSYDKARLTEFAAALSFARRNQVGVGEAMAFIEQNGGLKAIVAAERKLRQPQESDGAETIFADLRVAPALATVALAQAGDAEFVLLVARSSGVGRFDIVRSATDPALLSRAVRLSAG